MATPGLGPLKHRSSWIPRRLRERHWFWPKAAWIGFGWFGGIVDHPLSSFFAWVITLATIFGGGIALDVSPLILFVVVIAMFMFVVARGARLKWERDRGAGSGSEPSLPHTVTYMDHRTQLIVTDKEHAEQLVARLGGLEAGQLPNFRVSAPWPEQVLRPQADNAPADDPSGGAADDEDSKEAHTGHP